MAVPEHLSLANRPFSIGELSEFVFHLGEDVEFIATDQKGDIYGGITRSQMIEILKWMDLPTCSICNENHGRPTQRV